MSRTRLDVVLVVLVALVAVGLGAFLALRVDSAPSRFERYTCAGERDVRRVVGADAPLSTVQQAARAMAHPAGRVEGDQLRIGAIRARTWMHRLHHAGILAGVTDLDRQPVTAVKRVTPGAAHAWDRVAGALRTVRRECAHLGLSDDGGSS